MASASGSLSDTFKKVNHYRHMLMDFTMLTMAVGAVVATGGAMGLLDPVGIFLNMHLPSIEHISALGQFLPDAFNNAMSGTFFGSGDVAASMAGHAGHAGHMMHGAAPAGVPHLTDSARQLLGM